MEKNVSRSLARSLCVFGVRCAFTCLHLHSAIHRNKRENTCTADDVPYTHEIDMRSTVHRWTSAFADCELKRHQLWLELEWLSFSRSVFFHFEIGWVFFRCTTAYTYVTHINVVWVWRKTIFDSAWLQRLIFSQQHVYYRLESPLFSANTWLPKHTNPSNKHQQHE